MYLTPPKVGALRRLAGAAALVGLLATAPAAGAIELPRSLASLSPQDFASRIAVIDDPLEDGVVLSTKPAYKRDRSATGAHVGDAHLQSTIDRKTGARSWQISYDLYYAGPKKSLDVAQFRSGGELRKVSPRIAYHWQDECFESISICGQYVRVVVEIPEDTVREIAASYRAADRTPWTMRFKDANGADVTVGLAPAEAAGLLAAVQQRNVATPMAAAD